MSVKVAKGRTVVKSDSKQLAQQLVGHFNQRQLDEALALIDPEIRLRSPLGEARGIQQYRERLERLLAAYPDLTFTAEWTMGEGASLVITGTYSGTNVGRTLTGRTPAAAGTKVEFRACLVGRVRDGRLIEAEEFYDGLSLYRQLGLLPVAMAAPESEGRVGSDGTAFDETN